jgi:NAD+ synthase
MSNRVDNLLANYVKLDYQAEIDKIDSRIRATLRESLHRRGLVVAISGGIDSSVCAALAVSAIGAKRVYGILMPETDSSSDSLRRGQALANHLGINYTIQDIAPTLEAIGCYKWRDDAIKSAVPEYGEGWKNKIIIDGGTQGKINHFNLVVEDPEGNRQTKRLSLSNYLTIVAATNFKQRVRKNMDYFHADRLNYAVVGTPNRVEYDQGFFVKGGDGLADIKPIAHLYKTQVYDLARFMNLPEEICSATPTTDTYSLSQGQDEFYFSLPYNKMDVALWCYNNSKDVGTLAHALSVSEEQAQFIYKDIETKRKTTKYLHLQSLLIDQVDLSHQHKTAG